MEGPGNKIVDLTEGEYYGFLARGFHIELGEGVTPQQVNLCVLKRFFKKIPNNDCINFIKRKTDKIIFVGVTPGEYTDKFFEVIETIDDIEGIPINIVVPPELSHTLRIITHPELQYLNPDELQELLADVPGIKLIKKKATSTSAILGFDLCDSDTPSTVLLGWDTVKCRPLKPLPLRCYKCHKYGHQAGACRAEALCSRCSLPGHDHSTCSAISPKCGACGGAHDVFNNQCPEWLKRKKTYAAATKTYQKKEDIPPPAASQEDVIKETQDASRASSISHPTEVSKRQSSEDNWTTVSSKKARANKTPAAPNAPKLNAEDLPKKTFKSKNKTEQ